MGESPGLLRIAPAVYLPALLYGIGQGAIAPVVALSARDLGAAVATAGLVVAAAGLGQVVGDIPAGALTTRIGERRAMLGATGLVSVALVACLVVPNVWGLAAAIFTTGLAGAVWGLARQAYLSEAVPIELRARALSTLGGVQRIGSFIGPFLGAFAMRFLGTDGAYWVHLAGALLACVVLLSLPDIESVRRARTGRPIVVQSTRAVIREHLPVLRTLGVGALLVGAVRASRQVVIPLWAEHIGLDPQTTSLIFGVSGAVDMLLFYPAGSVMDRFGRKWVAVPSMAVLGLAHLLLPLTHSAGALTAVALLMGIGNGLGAGVIMTLGADASPPIGRAQFLGAFRLFADTGNGAGPLLIAAVTALAGLAPAVLVMGLTGWAAATAMSRWIPPHPVRPD
ncbi:putative MFS family arabinose efflux permease [Kribbella voronezhensis]|uniref:Putative MFS family arabinose efflux permease n=1 Tax=Kribbella voronezhensis TaxID=2512212 RepID=A0A4R7TF94_9ACTN|nr:MFS transporter [Kribbella voronezhensis]TDU90854.1 putative MFS family arabinose efflux permease [Kribbella voronezhensis]